MRCWCALKSLISNECTSLCMCTAVFPFTAVLTCMEGRKKRQFNDQRHAIQPSEASTVLLWFPWTLCVTSVIFWKTLDSAISVQPCTACCNHIPYPLTPPTPRSLSPPPPPSTSSCSLWKTLYSLCQHYSVEGRACHLLKQTDGGEQHLI